MTGSHRSFPRFGLLLAALLCATTLGMTWHSQLDTAQSLSPGMVMTTLETSPVTGDVSLGTYYMPGTVSTAPMRHLQTGAQSNMRIVIVAAALALGIAARRRSAAIDRAARLATIALAALVVFSLSRGTPAPTITLLAALALAAPITWPNQVSRVSMQLRH